MSGEIWLLRLHLQENYQGQSRNFIERRDVKP